MRISRRESGDLASRPIYGAAILAAGRAKLWRTAVLLFAEMLLAKLQPHGVVLPPPEGPSEGQEKAQATS